MGCEQRVHPVLFTRKKVIQIWDVFDHCPLEGVGPMLRPRSLHGFGMVNASDQLIEMESPSPLDVDGRSDIDPAADRIADAVDT
jgi:hypothetical protein